MADPNFGAVQQHADHVEPIRLRFPPMAVDPDHRRALQLLALAVVNCLHRTAEFSAFSSFDLDKSDRRIPLDHQIDIAMSAPEAPLDNPPSASPKPPLRYSLAELAKRLPGH